jgi:hypothetical protein
VTRPTPIDRRRAYLGAVIVALAGAAVAYLAVRRLSSAFPYPLDLAAALRGARVTAPATVRAALLVWAVLAVALASIAGWIRRHTRDWSVLECWVAALVVLWAETYAALLTLGPLGLYRPWILRGLLVATVLLTVGRPAPRRRRRPWTAGPWLLAAAFALTVVPIALLQVGSPVSPFMDVLGYVAPVQKIVTFQYYDPWANDPAGLWSPTRQVIGYDAFFSFLALVCGLPAHLAITAPIVPAALLQLLGVYLLVRIVAGRLAAGMATLFLLQTFLWRRTPDMRSTGLAFPLMAIGLAFLLHPRRDSPRLALGGLACGVGLTVSPLIAGVGMQVAAAAAVVGWLDFRRPLLPYVLALAGASLFAAPLVLVAFAVQLPPALLLVPVAVGVLLLVAVARAARAPRRRRLALGGAISELVIVTLPAAAMWLHASRSSELFNDNWFGYGVLLLLALGGLAVAAGDVWTRAAGLGAVIPAIALWTGVIDFAIADPRRFYGPLEMRSLASEVTPKMTAYWWPYWLAVVTGVWFAMVGRRWSVMAAAILALTLVVYPFHHVGHSLDYDGQQLSLAESWGFNLANAARGYHSGRGDRRWVLDPSFREVASILMQERAAGRLDYWTHVLLVSPSIDSVELALWTGISVDLITPQWDPRSIWNGNGRARSPEFWPQAIAKEPRYVLLQHNAPAQFPELAAYDTLYSGGYLHLFRRRGA